MDWIQPAPQEWIPITMELIPTWKSPPFPANFQVQQFLQTPAFGMCDAWSFSKTGGQIPFSSSAASLHINAKGLPAGLQPLRFWQVDENRIVSRPFMFAQSAAKYVPPYQPRNVGERILRNFSSPLWPRRLGSSTQWRLISGAVTIRYRNKRNWLKNPARLHHGQALWK